MRKFHTAANAILSRSKTVNEATRLHLLESLITLPMLTYGLNVLFLTQFQLKKLNSCWNSIYRRIFGFHKWESGKEIHFLCERMDLIHLINKFKLKFFGKLNWSNNCILNCCLHLLKQCNNLCQLYCCCICVGETVYLKVLWSLCWTYLVAVCTQLYK